MENVKKTALYDEHVKAGGKVIDFAGWALPVQYEGITQEHEAVRERAGLFDVSHMGEVSIKGKDAEKYVQNLVTNNVETLEENQILYTMMCYEDGGVVDDLLVYKFTSEDYFLVINAANIDKDYEWIVKQTEGFEVETVNLSDEYTEVAIQGPKAQEILQRVVDVDLKEVAFFYSKRDVNVAGVNCMISRTGYTGEDGFEVYAKGDDIVKVWTTLLSEGEELGLVPAGLGARDTLRFEACLPLYGNEISKDITPLEAGLGFFVKLDTDFIGKEALAKQKADGVTRKLVGFEMEKGIPRHGYEVYKNDQLVGEVTTGYQSPTLGKKIGLALVKTEFGAMGETFDIKVRKKLYPATIISKRFLKKNYKK